MGRSHHEEWILTLSAITACGWPSQPPCAEPATPRPTFPSAPALIASENQRAGDSSWWIDQPAAGEIEGYASELSVAAGGALDLFVSTTDPAFELSVYRIGWYDGAGARRMLGPLELAGVVQPPPLLDPRTGLAECHWRSSFHLEVPADPTLWPTGVYLAKLTALPSRKSSYAIFVVRDDQRRGSIVYAMPVLTYAAYSDWGGRSFYGRERAVKVSFDRPYAMARGLGAGDFLRWELPLVRFLEREGVEVTYLTNVDLDQRPELLESQRGFLSPGHDEYWTGRLRDAVEGARDRGTDLGFIGANAAYWQVRLEPNGRGTKRRVVVGYKQRAKTDDPAVGSPLTFWQTTTRFRDWPVSRPERAMIGLEYQVGMWDFEADLRIASSDHWLLAETGLKAGDALPGLAGGEGDRRPDDAPSCLEILASTPIVNHESQPDRADMATYRAPSGAVVLATGSLLFSRGLDRWYWPLGTARTSSPAKQLFRNFLHHARE